MRTLKVMIALVIATITTLLLAATAHAAPATFIVTNTSDSGPGSLRQAIEDANSNGNPLDVDVIEFDIAGSGVRTILPTTALPDVSEKAAIDGYSQPGSSVNTSVAPAPINSTVSIEIDLKNFGGPWIIAAGGSEVSGVSLFASGPLGHDGIVLQGDNISIRGSYIAVKADGATAVDSQRGGFMTSVPGATGIDFGGPDPADRNLIAPVSRSGESGTVKLQSDNGIFQGNYVGLRKDGVSSFYGSEANPEDLIDGMVSVQFQGAGWQIGGSVSSSRNVFSGALACNVVLAGNFNVFQGNYVGSDFSGEVRPTIKNGSGVSIAAGATGNLVGGTSTSQANLIKGVSGLGIGVVRVSLLDYSLVLTPLRNAILGNSISVIGVFDYPEFGSSNLGIDILDEQIASPLGNTTLAFAGQGPTANDPSDVDSGPNGYINTPVLKTAQQIGNQLTITYDLDAADSPSNTYRVEFFANDDSTVFGAGPAQEFLGADTPVSPGTGQSVTFTVSGDYTDKVLSSTTTAIDGTTASGFGSTSELSQNISVGSEDDFDADGIADVVEDAAPNGGDGNNDGIDDRLQPTVSSFLDYNDTNYITFVTEGCSENGTVSSLDVGTLEVHDNGYVYPHGMADFSLNCSRADTVDVTMYTYTDSDPSSFLVRKYNPSTNSFRDVPGANLVRESLGSNSVLTLTYSITDGGELDDDGSANGLIVDPVGLAIEGVAGQSLADTGDDVRLLLLGALALWVVGVATLRRTRRRGASA